MLSKLTCQVFRLAVRNQFNDVCVVAPRLVYKFGEVKSAAANQNYFARNLALSSIVHDSKKDIDNPKSRKKRTKYTNGFSAKDDKKIIEYVKKFGKKGETWKKLANIFGRIEYGPIKAHYEFYIESTPTVTGKFSEKEDEFILSFVEKNGKDSNSLNDLTKQLGRGSPGAVLERHEKLVSNNVRDRKKWELFEEKELMKAIFNIKEMNPRDLTSLETVLPTDFNLVSQKLQRTISSCDSHWNKILLPILKTYLKDLPLNAEWKKDFMLYVIKHKIRHRKELDLDLLVEEVLPGQTSVSVLRYANNTVNNYKRTVTQKKLKDLPLYEIMKMQLNAKGRNSSVFNEKVMEKHLQRKNDIVHIYESII